MAAGQMAAFLDACPSHITVVISSRMDPPVHLGRLRVRGQLREIRARDLRFDAEEAATMFDQLDVSPADVALMCERTEGWAAGLVLAALSLSRSPDPGSFVQNFAGNNRMVVDYLTTELWDTLPDDIRDFFLNASILDKMCGPLVDALMDSDGLGAGRHIDGIRVKRETGEPDLRGKGGNDTESDVARGVVKPAHGDGVFGGGGGPEKEATGGLSGFVVVVIEDDLAVGPVARAAGAAPARGDVAIAVGGEDALPRLAAVGRA